MTHPLPVDLELASVGYLRDPDGRLYYIHGLDVIAQDTLRAGAQVYWDDERARRAGHCFLWERVILLAPWLVEHYPFVLRRVWSHELGHAMVGPSEERVTAWQLRRYGALLEPVWI